jgi:hypothetical protein
VLVMRILIGALYLATALVGLYWSVYLTLTGLYGVPFSRWYVVLLIGGVVLLIGAILWWTSNREWTRWFPIIGSALLGSYFVPAFITMVRQGGVDLIRVIIVALVLMSLVVSVKERHVTTNTGLQRQ